MTSPDNGAALPPTNGVADAAEQNSRTFDWLFQRLQPESVPSVVFHYTSPAGILGILGNRELWATHVAFLNDASEFRYTVDLAKQQISQRIQSDVSEAERTLLAIWDQSLQNMSGVDLYVTSLSENGDLLSQWRAYCPPLGGFSLGFDTVELMQTAQFPLLRCIYEPDVQEELLRMLLDKLVLDVAELAGTGADAAHVGKFASIEFLVGLVYLGAVFKHPAFHEEGEWRLITRDGLEDIGQTEFRVGRSGIVPFKTLSLGSGAEALRSVTVGPNQHPELAMNAVDALLNLRLSRPIEKIRSGIPSRAW